MTWIYKTFTILFLISAVISAGCISSKPPVSEDSQNIPVNSDLDAKIVKVTLDREKIIAGEKVSADLLIGNTGTIDITNETVILKAKVLSLDDFLANLYLNVMSDEQKSMSYTINFSDEIKAGKIAPISAVFKTEKEMKGKSLAGTYDVTIRLYANGQYEDSEKLIVRLSPGNPRNIEPASTTVPNTTSTIQPTSTMIIENTPSPTPTPTPEPVVVATPTGRIVYSRVKSDAFGVSYHKIYAGDAILWDNYDVESSYDYTIVELNGKLPDIKLLQARKLTYIFNTTGEYKFGLYYGKLKGEPSTQTIKVIANTTAPITNNTSNVTNTTNISVNASS